MKLDLWKSFLLMAATIPASACEAHVSRVPIPETGLFLDDVIFYKKFDGIHYLTNIDGVRLCSGSYLTKASDGTSRSTIGFVLGTKGVRFSGDSEACDLTILPPHSSREIQSDNFSEVYSNGCRFYFRLGESSLSNMEMVGPEDSVQFDRCLYRAALVSMGYNGVLTVSDENLFVPSDASPWAGVTGVTKEVPLFQYILRACDFKMRVFDDLDDLNRSVKTTRCGMEKSGLY